MTPRDVLISRIAPNAPRTDLLRGIVGNLFGLSQRLDAERSKLKADTGLSDVGRREKEAEFARGLVKNLIELTKPLRRGQAEAAAKRAAMQPKPIDRSDIVGELQRRELREFVRSLPLEKRVEAVFTLGDEHLEAITSAPAILSGLPDDRYAKIVEIQREKQFGSQIRALESDDEDLTAVGSAGQMVRRNLQVASGLSDADFLALENTYEH